jgi:hypothetical protein
MEHIIKSLNYSTCELINVSTNQLIPNYKFLIPEGLPQHLNRLLNSLYQFIHFFLCIVHPK